MVGLGDSFVGFAKNGPIFHGFQCGLLGGVLIVIGGGVFHGGVLVVLVRNICRINPVTFIYHRNLW